MLMDVDLGFSEFALVAILLLVMYGISMMHWTTLKAENYVAKPAIKQGAVWAVIGIVLALLLGIYAALGALPFEGPALAFILVFPLGWLSAELAHGRVVSAADVNSEFDRIYRRIILQTLRDNGPLAEGDLYEAVINNTLVKVLRALPLDADMHGILPGVLDTVKEWTLTFERFQSLLRVMCSRRDGSVRKQDDGKFCCRV